MKCLNCARLDLQNHRAMAKLGWGQCSLEPSFAFRSVIFEHNCKKSQPALPDVVAKREAWARKL